MFQQVSINFRSAQTFEIDYALNRGNKSCRAAEPPGRFVSCALQRHVTMRRNRMTVHISWVVIRICPLYLSRIVACLSLCHRDTMVRICPAVTRAL